MTDELKDAKPARKKPRVSVRGVKAKGSDYEREVAAWLNDNIPGLSARRALLSGGGRSDGGSDIEGAPMLHLELKRTEAFAPKAAMAQAEAAVKKAASGLVPVVVSRSNRMATEDSLVVMRLKDFAAMYRIVLAAACSAASDGG